MPEELLDGMPPPPKLSAYQKRAMDVEWAKVMAILERMRDE